MNPSYTLRQLCLYFLKLGAIGFGGPVALVGYMHQDLVERRKWMTDEEYKEGLALAQLAPGPLAAQLSIYLGFVHYRHRGAAMAGIAFVLPSFLMVVLLGMAYKLFGGMPWMRAVFYGVGAAVTGIIAISCYKLGIKSISKLSPAQVRQHWMLWAAWLIGLVMTMVTRSEPLWWLIGAAFVYMFVKAPPAWLRTTGSSVPSLFFLGIGFWDAAPGALEKIGWFFFKAGAFVFGSGLAIVPFLHGGVVEGYHWLNETEFLDAVAVAMITPGPVVITVGFIGYLVAGFPGAAVAALATFLPCYLFTVIPAPHFKRIARNISIKAFVDGITAAVVGSLTGSVVLIALRSVYDWPTGLLAVASCLALIYIKKLKEPYIILIAATAGFLLKMVIY